VTVELDKPLEDQFPVWMAAQKRNRILTDEIHATITRVISTKDTSHPMYKQWHKKGYFEDRLTLHLNVDITPKRPRGKSAISVITIDGSSSESDTDHVASIAAPAAAASPSRPQLNAKRVPKQSEVLTIIAERHAEGLHGGARATHNIVKIEEEFVGVPRILVSLSYLANVPSLGRISFVDLIVITFVVVV
jgi:hypothetical protein